MKKPKNFFNLKNLGKEFAIQPFPGTVQDGAVAVPGYVMKVTMNGFLFELDVVNFRAGAVLLANFQIPGTEHLVSEKVRSIKHYDRFFRKPPKKKSKVDLDVTSAGVALDAEDKPKKLVEFHFVQINSENRIALHKYIMQLSVETMKKMKK